MNCFICDQAPQTGTMRYAVAEAMGVCHDCGTGVCAKHSRKEDEPGSPLLCIPCASLRDAASFTKAA
jgi:hypothetical protein